MSYPPPQYPPPADPAASGKRRLRGRIPLRLALILGVLGAALVAVGAVVLLNSPLSKIDEFARVSVAQGQGTVHLTRTGSYVAYYETPQNAAHHAFVQLQLTDPSGNPVPLAHYGGGGTTQTSLTYSWNGRHGEAIFTFHISRAGDYRAQVASDTPEAGAGFAFGESIAHGLVTGIALVIPGVLLLIAALVLLIVGLVRRSGHKRELRDGHGAGGGYPGGPPWPPPPGYQGGYPPQGGYPQQGGYPPQG